MTCLSMLKINNAPDKLIAPCVVVQLINGALIYYGQYKKDRAAQVAKELGPNALVIERWMRNEETNSSFNNHTFT